MIDFEQALEAVYRTPAMTTLSLRQPKLSFPLLKVVDGKMYGVFMGYSYGDIVPDKLFVYDPEFNAATQYDVGEGLEFLGIKKFPVEDRFDVEPGDPEFMNSYLLVAMDGDPIDKENYEMYISTIVRVLTHGEGKYYWAFAD